MDYCSFVIMDERSLTDDTVLLVNAPAEGEDGEVQSVRVAFEIAHWRLSGYSMAMMDMGVDRAVAEAAEDGVLRVRYNPSFLPQRQYLMSPIGLTSRHGPQTDFQIQYCDPGIIQKTKHRIFHVVCLAGP